MHPTNLRMLIIGSACFILGPPLGYLLTIFGFFRQMAQPPAQDLQGALQSFARMPGDMMANIIPIGIGVVIGGTGLFLIVLAFIKHFLAPPVSAPLPAASSPFTTPVVREFPPPSAPIRKVVPIPPTSPPLDDSRYMPKG